MSTPALLSRLQSARTRHGYGFIRSMAKSIGMSERQAQRWLNQKPGSESTKSLPYDTAEKIIKFLKRIEK